MTNKTMKNLQIAWTSIIYADSTGADSSGADNKVSKALFTSAQRVPDTRPKPEIFSNTQSIPEIFSESLGISGIGYFRK